MVLQGRIEELTFIVSFFAQICIKVRISKVLSHLVWTRKAFINFGIVYTSFLLLLIKTFLLWMIWMHKIQGPNADIRGIKIHQGWNEYIGEFFYKEREQPVICRKYSLRFNNKGCLNILVSPCKLKVLLVHVLAECRRNILSIQGDTSRLK